MSGTTRTLQCYSEVTLSEVAAALKSAIGGDLLLEDRQSLGEGEALLLSFERYYWRNGSYASLTVMLTAWRDRRTASIVGSGGGEGLFNISLGANADFAAQAVEVLRKFGFRP